MKAILEQEVADARQFSVQEDKLVFRSGTEKEFIEGLLKDLLEIQHKAKRYRIKPAMIDDLVKVADASGTVQVFVEQLVQNIDDERIEAVIQR